MNVQNPYTEVIRGESVHSYVFYHSDEFKAVCKLLGIPHGMQTTSISIELPIDGFVTVHHSYRAKDHSIIEPETPHTIVDSIAVPESRVIHRPSK